MIVMNQGYSFGAKVAEISTTPFHIAVSTAKEGLFKRLSTVIVDKRTGDAHPVAKILWAIGLNNEKRRAGHDALVEVLNNCGEDGISLSVALIETLNGLKARGFVREAMIAE